MWGSVAAGVGIYIALFRRSVWKLPARVVGAEMHVAARESQATWWSGSGQFNLSLFGANYKLNKWVAGLNPQSPAPDLKRVLVAEFAAAPGELGDRPRLLHLAYCKNVPLAMVRQLAAPRAPQGPWAWGTAARSSGGWSSESPCQCVGRCCRQCRER